MNVKLAELKKADPSLAHKEAFQKAFDAWKVRLRSWIRPFLLGGVAWITADTDASATCLVLSQAEQKAKAK